MDLLAWTSRNGKPLLPLARVWASSAQSRLANGTPGPRTISWAASNACSRQTTKLMNITTDQILDFRLSHFDIEIRMRSKDGKTTTFPSLTPPAPDLAQVVSDAVEYKIGHEEWITREQFELRLNDEN